MTPEPRPAGTPTGGLLPDGIAEHARRLRDGLVTPSPTRDAATVALLRAGPAGPEVYLLRRVSGMAFAGGMHVFPGGSVDPADAQTRIAWAGPSPAAWAQALGCDEPRARALVCAAVRETFEECGVLLAGPTPADLLDDVSSDDWESERAALESREHSLSEMLAARGLVLRSDLLRPLAHWITPEAEPKRFDTRFFLAEMPTGQVCRDVGGEADQRLWIRPADALEQRLRMLVPTQVTLQDLAQHREVAAALGFRRQFAPIMPKVVLDDAGDAVVVHDG